MARSFQIAHGTVASGGAVQSGTGFWSWRIESGQYILRFEELQYEGAQQTHGFKSSPAVLFTPIEDEDAVQQQRAARVNWMDLYKEATEKKPEKKEEDRRVAAQADGYRVWDGKDANGKPKLSDIPFHALAFAGNATTPVVASRVVEPSKSALPPAANAAESAKRDLQRTLTGDDAVNVVGGIYYTASPAVGHGCTITRDGAGHYTVNFTPGTFSEAPTVTATIQGYAAEADRTSPPAVRTIQVQKAVSASAAKLSVRDGDGKRVDSDFAVLAVGASTTNAAGKRFLWGVVNGYDGSVISGPGFSSAKEAGTKATFKITPTARFSQEPIVVACSEHQEEAHVRLMRARPYRTTNDPGADFIMFQVVGREKHSDKPGYNDARFHFVAFAPS